MGKFNGKDATVWMRSIRPHTYEHKPQDEGAIYLAHEEMVETIEILGMAVRETPPPKAVRTPVATPNQPDVPVLTTAMAPASAATPTRPKNVRGIRAGAVVPVDTAEPSPE